MTKAAVKARLEALGEASVDTLSEAMEKTKSVVCRSCSEVNFVKVPDSVAVRASVAVLDRTGHGPTQKIQPVKPESEDIQGLAEELCQLPLETRVALAIRMLPEHAAQLDALGLKRISLVGEIQAGATN